MMMLERRDFCISCRKDTDYVFSKKKIKQIIREKEYEFNITVAICTECGEEMSIPGLMDLNVKEIDEQYRAIESIVTIDDINKLMKIYNIGKKPLSSALGFGEVTIERYVEGQVPSKEYSDVIRKALTSPNYMMKLLEENKNKITKTAYEKAISAAKEIVNLFSVSDKMLRSIQYIFNQLEEVTPLLLQKLLYFAQGIFLSLYNKPLFVEDCEAWIHGPVYPKVYNLFKDFKYNPIDDERFAILEGSEDALTDEERNVIDIVLDTFGLYSGKTLEKITHNEEPWKSARTGYSDDMLSNELISKDSIKKYFDSVNSTYPLDKEEEIKKYIYNMLNM